MNLFDYIKYSLFNIRTPELVEKMRINEYAKKVSSQKYKFVEIKTKNITSNCAKFIYEIYKIIVHLLPALKDEFIVRDGKQFSYYLIEVSFNNEIKEIYATLNKEYMLTKIKAGKNPNSVFEEIKGNFLKFKNYLSGENGKEINLTFNLIKDFANISNFDFFLFLRSFCPSFADGVYNANPDFKNTSNPQVVDDLTKLDDAVNSIMIKKELISALNIFCNYAGLSQISDKNMKALLTRLRYLQTPNLLSDIIIFLLKDFTYKPHVSYSDTNIFVNYITDFAKNLKNDMESIIKDIKNSKIANIRNKTFSGIEILKLTNVNEDKNSQLEEFDCEVFTCIEPLQYIKTFVSEIFDMEYKAPLNDMFLGCEFVHKERNSQGLDAFYTLNDSKEEIQMFDSTLSPESDNFKRLRTWLVSKNKANANRDLIENMVKKIDGEGNKIVLNVYNSILDLTTILKNIIEDCVNGTKIEISNASRISTLEKFSVDIAKKMLIDFENFISLMKNFVR